MGLFGQASPRECSNALWRGLLDVHAMDVHAMDVHDLDVHAMDVHALDECSLEKYPFAQVSQHRIHSTGFTAQASKRNDQRTRITAQGSLSGVLLAGVSTVPLRAPKRPAIYEADGHSTLPNAEGRCWASQWRRAACLGDNRCSWALRICARKGRLRARTQKADAAGQQGSEPWRRRRGGQMESAWAS